MYDFSKDLIYFVRRDGTTTNPYQNIEEDLTVQYDKAFLKEVPVQAFKVVVKNGNQNLTEVNSLNDLINNYTYYVDYRQGIVYFNSLLNGTRLNFKYSGQGVILYPSSRIYVDTDGSGNIVKTLRDIIDGGSEAIKELEKVQVLIDNAKEALDRIDTIVVEANEVVDLANVKINELQNIINNADTLINNKISEIDGFARDEINNKIDNIQSQYDEKESIWSANEDIRISNENARISAENEREASESTRISNEESRISNEENRNIKEIERNNNEEERISAEDTRKSNELSRIENENIRNQSENERSSAELERNNAESLREENEENRQLEENIRQSNESQRELSENLRVSNENARISAEQSRIDSENIRQQQEDKRQLDTAKAIQDSEIATASAIIAKNDADTATANTINAMNEAVRATQELNELIDNTKFTEEYSFNKQYRTNNIVSFNGSSYIAKQDTIGNEPTNSVYWGLLAQRGVDGEGSVSSVNGISPDLSGNIVITPEMINAENKANKGVANGYASLDANAKIPLSQIPDTLKQQTYVVATTDDRLALTGLISGDKAFEVATGDSYIYDGTDWQVLADADWENVNLDWTNILNKPSSSILEIDDSVSKAHTHSNRELLEKFTVVDGKLRFDGKNIGSVDSVNGYTGVITLTANDVGAYSKSEIDGKVATLNTAIGNKIDKSEKGVANGLALLNSEGRVVDANGNEVTGSVTSVNGQVGDIIGLETVENSNSKLANKVDKVEGKQLSTEDYTTIEKEKLYSIEVGANKYIHPSTHPASMITEDSQHRFVTDDKINEWDNKIGKSEKGVAGGVARLNSSGKVVDAEGNEIESSINSHLQTELDKKVDKVTGKQLSTEDFTTAEKSKLANIEENANNYILPSATSTSLGGVKVGTNINITDGTISVEDGTTSNKGVVQLSDSISSTSTTLGATANAVKLAYDKAISAELNAKLYTDAGLDGKIDKSEKGVANGVARLNAEGKVVDANGNEVKGRVTSVNGQIGDVDILIPSKISDLTNDVWSVVSQAEAEAGIDTTVKLWTAQRVKQAIDKHAQPIADTALSNAKSYTDAELNKKIDKSDLGVANGVARLNAEGKVVDVNGNEVTGSVTSVNGQIGDVIIEIPEANVFERGKDVSATGDNSNAEGYKTEAIGDNSHTEGRWTIAYGENAHAEGEITLASARASHTEGIGTYATNAYFYRNITSVNNNTKEITVDDSSNIEIGDNADIPILSGISIINAPITSVNDNVIKINTDLDITEATILVVRNDSATLPSHAEGYRTMAIGGASHSEGRETSSNGQCSHAEGYKSISEGNYSHAEGNSTYAGGNHSHAEGDSTTASGTASHSEGYNTIASGYSSHAEGASTKASGNYSHAEGYNTEANGGYSHAEGRGTTASNIASHAEGYGTIASGDYSHVEGYNTEASNTSSHAEGNGTEASGYSSHAEGVSTTASGYSSHAEGDSTTASGMTSHAEGSGTTASGDYSHVEGYGTVAGSTGTPIISEITTAGHFSHAEGNGAMASGNSSHAEGRGTIASGTASHAEGYNTIASGYSSHAEGYYTTTSGSYSHAEGYNTTTSDVGSHAEGAYTIASGVVSHAEGDSTEASGYSSHAEGGSTEASGNYSHAEGYSTTAIGNYSHAEGFGTVAGSTGTPTISELNTAGYFSHAEGNGAMASGNSSHAEGYSTKASGIASHAEGASTTASGVGSHAEGAITTASGDYSHAEGYNTKASVNYSHAEGASTKASGMISHAEGYGTTASGDYSHSANYNTTADSYASTAIGVFNKTMSGSVSSYSASSDAFVIGNGTTNSAKGNAFRVTFGGKAYGLSSYNSTGADYAEYFEWMDGNVDDEDRVGYFVTLEGDKIRKATADDKYILGIISVNPSVVGDSHQDDWSGRYLTDEWGRIQYDWIDVEHIEHQLPILNEETGQLERQEPIIVIRKEYRPLNNPNWNPEKEYIPRENRKEWTMVGLMGKLLVRDDGTCQVNGYCKPNDDGIATSSNEGYRVMERVSENIIRVFVK